MSKPSLARRAEPQIMNSGPSTRGRGWSRVGRNTGEFLTFSSLPLISPRRSSRCKRASRRVPRRGFQSSTHQLVESPSRSTKTFTRSSSNELALKRRESAVVFAKQLNGASGWMARSVFEAMRALETSQRASGESHKSLERALARRPVGGDGVAHGTCNGSAWMPQKGGVGLSVSES